MFTDRFQNQSAIITGGASGLGRAVARRLITEGARVSIWDLDKDAAAKTAKEIGAHDSAGVDVSDYSSVDAAMLRSVGALGSLDILINSAGITGPTAPLSDYPVEAWHRTVNINLFGVFHCCRAALPHFVENRFGRVLNVASVAGKEGNPNASAYSASKAGVIAMTKSIAKEVALNDVMVNALAPAAFDSPLFEQMPKSQLDYMRSKIPMGRFGTLDENVAMACFAVSKECSFTTGAVFDTSGGRLTY